MSKSKIEMVIPTVVEVEVPHSDIDSILATAFEGIDASGADMIVQYAVFGELVYG